MLIARHKTGNSLVNWCGGGKHAKLVEFLVLCLNQILDGFVNGVDIFDEESIEPCILYA